MLTPKSISHTTPQKQQARVVKNQVRLMVNTFYIGTVTLLNAAEATVTVNIFNQKAVDCQIFKNAPGNTADISGYYFQPIGTATLRYFCPAFLQATPQIGDTVAIWVPQSSIESFFDGTAPDTYGGDYPIAEALVFPIKTGYTNNTEMVINPESNLVPNVQLNAPNLTITSTTGEIDATSFKINCSTELQLIGLLTKISATQTQIDTTKLAITGNGGEIITALVLMLTALAATVPLPTQTLDISAGGAISTLATYLALFEG